MGTYRGAEGYTDWVEGATATYRTKAGGRGRGWSGLGQGWGGCPGAGAERPGWPTADATRPRSQSVMEKARSLCRSIAPGRRRQAPVAARRSAAALTARRRGPNQVPLETAPPEVGNVASSSVSLSRSSGLTRCESNPASCERRRSESCPQPVKATRVMCAPQG